MSVRAGIVVTGTEVLTGRVRDRNGPWVGEQLSELGVDLAHITICGDRPEDMEAQLRFLAGEGVEVIVTSGGLGPTADDLTMAVVARFCGREMRLDAAVEARIAAILEPLMKRWPDLDPEAVLAANRKQAILPEGASVLDPAGTAPGAVVPPQSDGKPTVVVLPGPPRELHQMWPAAVATAEFQRAIAGAGEYRGQMLRIFGIPESEIAETLRLAEDELGPPFAEVEITTCLRRGEVELVARWQPAAQATWDRIAEIVGERHARTLFSTDGSLVDDQVAELLTGRSLALAESCTGGLMAARLIDRPGASAYVAGAIVAYADAAKRELLGVDGALLERHGAVSPEAAEAMADGALERLAADTALAITGIAGPGGGTEEKPVGYVCWCAKRSDGALLARSMTMPGNRTEIRDRSTTFGMHLLRRLLRGEEFPL
ncbi:MAG: competence/damage-inducible protein A [Thermoleophilaceae bacterium]|nr:competence/damage-inducible protein A [Thermoleophilaceae bacterium]